MEVRNLIYSLLLGLGLALSGAAYGHFFAKMEWYNPATGQTLTEYAENHATTNTQITALQQQQAVIQEAKKAKNSLVMVEDVDSLAAQFNFDDTSDENKQAIGNRLSRFNDASPLTVLCAHCFVQGIDTLNIECRPPCATAEDIEKLHIDEKHIQEIAAYKDHPVLDKFYAQLNTHATKLAQLQNNPKNSRFHYECFVVNARALHTIFTSNHNHYILAAGVAHLVSMNIVLEQLGWQLRNITLPTTATEQEQDALETVVVSETDDQAAAMHAFFTNYTKHRGIIRAHALDMSQDQPSSLIRHYLTVIATLIRSIL